MLVSVDPATSRHSDDVELLADELCEQLGVEGQDRETLLLAARLHDIGKTAIRQELLEKREPLDPRDWKLIKKHTIVGERILARVPELASAAPLVRHSHENFDGSGYPDGLRGDEIPFGSRIICCVDAFHAIRCDRPYRNGSSTDAALAEIKAHAGRQFDPTVVKALAKSIASARRPGRRRIPRRVAVLFAALAIGSAGAYATERGWIPSLIPGFGPESSSDNETDQAVPTGSAPSSVGDSPTTDGERSAQGNAGGDPRDLIDAIVGANGPRSARDRDFLGLGGFVSGLGGAVGNSGSGGDRAPDAAGGAGGQGDGTDSGEGSIGSSGSSSGAGGGAAPGGSAAHSGSAPAQGGSPPGNSGSAQGHGGSPPGQSGSAPGQSGLTPGQSGSTPGSGGSPPGQSGSAPGLSGSTPGQSGSAPGQGSTPGNSGSAPGHNKP